MALSSVFHLASSYPQYPVRIRGKLPKLSAIGFCRLYKNIFCLFRQRLRIAAVAIARCQFFSLSIMPRKIGDYWKIYRLPSAINFYSSR